MGLEKRVDDVKNFIKDKRAYISSALLIAYTCLTTGCAVKWSEARFHSPFEDLQKHTTQQSNYQDINSDTEEDIRAYTFLTIPVEDRPRH